ncbi:MAG: hypothetical protein IH627_17690 [Rubrivivax sp.]|nr:hypothetical protein [Rubrivivax sp.]
MKTYKTPSPLTVLGTVAVVAGAVALASSCGGGGGGSDEPQASAATIDTAGVTSAINDFGGIVGICKEATGAMRIERKLAVAQALRGAMGPGARSAPPFTKTRLALGSTPPADQLGDCGGRFGYRDYSHVNGVTTATLSFDNYCSLDSSTGERQSVDGAIAFVNTATPTASGPITTQLVADASRPLTVAVQSSTGASVSSQTLNFTGFKTVVGVPGGTPTAASPNVMSLTDLTVKNNTTGKTYRESNYLLKQHETPAGNTEMTFSGRGYRSNGSYFEIATTQPVVLNADGDTVSGVFTFTGANGSNAVATLVPGSTMQATLTVNGVPVTSVPVCTH